MMCRPRPSPRLGLAGAQEDLSLALSAAARLADKAQAAELRHVAPASAEPLSRHQGLAAAAPTFDAERIHAAHIKAVQVRGSSGHTTTRSDARCLSYTKLMMATPHMPRLDS